MKRRCYDCACWEWLLDERMEHERDARCYMHEEERQGTCRRFPPALDISEAPAWKDYMNKENFSYLDYRFWNHPVTEGGNWCAEWREKLT